MMNKEARALRKITRYIADDEGIDIAPLSLVVVPSGFAIFALAVVCYRHRLDGSVVPLEAESYSALADLLFQN